nr:D-aminoacylase [Clostridia bacterium]
MYDLIIKNGKIIDGTGTPHYYADVAVKDGKIAKIAKKLDGAAHIINAKGLTVTPGFIDSHSHSDGAVFSNPDMKEKLEQGITTSVGGQCGSTSAPNKPIGMGSEDDVYRTMGSFLTAASELEQGASTAVFVGHSALRRATMGIENRKPTETELEQMKELLREGIAAGAVGVSFGLIYTPSCYAETDELIELAKVAAEMGAVVSAHIRNEDDHLIKAVTEFIEIIEKSGARGVISHHKAMVRENWGKVNTTLRMIDEANARGCEIFCDVYPYTASSTSLSARFMPPEYRSEGLDGMKKYLSDPETYAKIKDSQIKRWGRGLDWVLVTSAKGYPQYTGKRIPEIAEMIGKDEYDTVFDIIIGTGNNCSCCFFTMCEEDVETVMAHPRAMLCTDSSVAGTSTSFHPRLSASMPRVLGHYTRERRVVPLYEMVRKLTAMPAAVYGLKGKGVLREGFDADICIFNDETIIDRATFVDPTQRCEGLSYVIVGGEVVVEDAVHNGKMCGKVLRVNS